MLERYGRFVIRTRRKGRGFQACVRSADGADIGFYKDDDEREVATLIFFRETDAMENARGMADILDSLNACRAEIEKPIP